MVATTVIEVGVNVPNASVMIIEVLSALDYHNFINCGRVGRGADQSCIHPDQTSSDSKTRMQTMVKYQCGLKLLKSIYSAVQKI
jgi:RecG-like helicase